MTNYPVGDDPNFPYSDWRYAVINGDTRSGYTDWVASQVEANTSAVTVDMIGHYGTFSVQRRTFVYPSDLSDEQEVGDLVFEKSGIYEDLRAAGWTVTDEGDAGWDFVVIDGPLAGTTIDYC